MNESPETLKYLWYPELEIYGLETFTRQKVLKEMSGVRIMKNKTINYELKWGIDIYSEELSAIIFSASTSPYRVRWTLMTIPWMLMRVSFKLEAVSFQYINQGVSNDLSDYDTEEVVMCKAHFIYDVHRQRSLQHLIQIEELPSHFKTVRLPSGQKPEGQKITPVSSVFYFFYSEFSDFNPQKKTKWRTWTFKEFLASIELSAKMSTYHQN